MHRREFVKCAATTPLATRLESRLRHSLLPDRAPLIRPDERATSDLTLAARAGRARIAPDRWAVTWTPTAGDHAAVAPILRTRTGEFAGITLENQLAEPTILHWHGLHVPEDADGHPRLAIPPDATYRYDFPVLNRAGTYWYHAHPHMRTGAQVYLGMAGMLLVGDEAEDALGLPAGVREIPLLLQDRRQDGEALPFEPVMHERMEGFFGDIPFGNGAPDPTVDVDTALHRLRVVNATGARILRLALSTGAPMTLIGTDGGLLPAPRRVDAIDLGTGERADLLVDFTDVPVGRSVMLKSLPFTAPGGMGMGMGRMMAGGTPQGTELDLLEFRVTRAVREPAWAARPFPTILPIDPSGARTREFRFQSAMMRHTINGREFEMDRIDAEVPFGSTEIWRFINEGPFPHPVHMHEVQFQVLAREGGRGRLFPWEGGWKDTVLVHPGETVSVIATFDRHRGRYLMHCHNLMHEDMGMMMNFAVS